MHLRTYQKRPTGHLWTSTVPTVSLDGLQEMQIQPAQAEAPLAGVAVRALEVDRSRALLGWHVPAAAALIRNKREPIGFRDLLRVVCV